MEQQPCTSRLSLRVVLALLAPVAILTDLAVIAVFIFQENWYAVIYSGVVLLALMQAIYWYFRSRSFILQVVPRRNGGLGRHLIDDPPPYEEVIKSEAPPPPYFMVVSEVPWYSYRASRNTVKTHDYLSPLKGGAPPPSYGAISPCLTPTRNDQASARTAGDAPVPAVDVGVDPVAIMRSPVASGLLLAPTHRSPTSSTEAAETGSANPV